MLRGQGWDKVSEFFHGDHVMANVPHVTSCTELAKRSLIITRGASPANIPVVAPLTILTELAR